jgi:hypothetical protein
MKTKPLGIHFASRAVVNTVDSLGEFHLYHKDEGDFLLLETEEGDS